MKNTDKKQGALWPTAEAELVKKAREELRKRIMEEELECVRQQAVNGLLIHLQVDAKSFHRLWIQPLTEAGATLDMALVCIAQSCFQPN